MKDLKTFNEVAKGVEKEKVWVITPGIEMRKLEEKDTPFLIDRMLVEGAINLLASEGGKGKSILALKMANDIAQGKPFLEQFKTKEAKVLYLDMEQDSNTAIGKYHSIVEEEADEKIDLLFRQIFLIDDEGAKDWLKETIKDKGYGLVIIDTLSTFHSKEDISNKEMAEIHRALLEIAHETGATFLLIHHYRKNMEGNKSSQSSVRGATEIPNKCASVIGIDSYRAISLQRETITRIRVEQHKARLPEKFEPFEVDCIYNPEAKKTSWRYLGLLDEEAGALERAKILIINSLAGGEKSIKDFMKEKEERGIEVGVKNIRQACKELEIVGKIIIRTGEGKQWRTKFYSLADTPNLL